MDLYCIDWSVFKEQNFLGKIFMCLLPIYVYAFLLPLYIITFPFYRIHEKTSEYF